MAITDQGSEGKVWGIFKLPFRQNSPSISSSTMMHNSVNHNHHHNNNNNNGEASNSQVVAAAPSVTSVARSLLPTRRRLRLDPSSKLYFPCCDAINLGTGHGASVLEMVNAFEKASGKKIPLNMCPRRPGDATEVYASTEKAAKELGWKAKYDINDMCRDQWKWANSNPYGYQGKPE